MAIGNAINVQLAGSTGTGAFVGSVSPTVSGQTTDTLTVTDAAGITISGLTPVVTVKRQIFSTNGTYTPSTGMLYAIVEVLGGGGGSGGIADITGANYGISGGGAAGGYCQKLLDAATIGASQAITIGAGGAGGAAGANPGSTGGTSSFGAILTSTGGAGGGAGVIGTAAISVAQSVPGAGSGGDINGQGCEGQYCFAVQTVGLLSGSNGGGCFYCCGTQYVLNGGAVAASGYGSGASGIAYDTTSGGALAGADGSNGAVIITEFCNQ